MLLLLKFMCKYCSKNSDNILLSNNSNHNKLSTYCGRYVGILIDSSITMHYQFIECSINAEHLTRSNAYYEANGVDVDDPTNHTTQMIEIKNCPYCGKILDRLNADDKVYFTLKHKVKWVGKGMNRKMIDYKPDERVVGILLKYSLKTQKASVLYNNKTIKVSILDLHKHF